MERFTAHEVGGKLGIPLTAQWSPPSVSVDLSYTHYSRSNGLHMNIGAGSLTTTW